MTALRAAVAALLLLGVYALALVLVGLGLVTTVAPLAGYLTTPGEPVMPGAVVGLLSFATVMFVAGGGVLIAVRSARPGAHSVRLYRSDAPALWQLVREVATAAGTRAPTEIRLTSRMSAEIHENTRVLGLIPGTRRLDLGVPLLAGMSRDGLRSVLCHELGHYARPHTWLAPMVYRGAVALRITLARLDAARTSALWFAGLAALTCRVFGAYVALFFRVAGEVLHRQEIEADAASAFAVGPDRAIDALCTLHALAAVWDDMAADARQAAARPGGAPLGAPAGDMVALFTRVLADAPDVFAALKASPPEREPTPYDSHPSLARRLEYLRLRPRVEREEDPTPAMVLLADPPQAYASMGAEPTGARNSRRSRIAKVATMGALGVASVGIVAAALSPPKTRLPVAGKLVAAATTAPASPTAPTNASPADLTTARPRLVPTNPAPPARASAHRATPIKVVLHRGDTLAKLATCYHTTVTELRRLNHIGAATTLRAGDSLHLPNVAPSPGCR